MSKKAVIITLVSVCVLGGAIYGGIKLYQNYQWNSLTAEVQSVSSLNMYFGDMEMSSGGILTNDYSQEVYLLDDKNIEEVFVEEGQEVEVGDPLLSYDMTLSDLELEMKELDVATTSGQMEAAKQELSKLKNTKPIAPQPEPEPPQEAPKPEKTGKAFNYITKNSKPNKGKGTEEKPYVYLCMPDCYVLGEFINNLSKDEDKPIYVSLEIHKKQLGNQRGKRFSADGGRFQMVCENKIADD